MKGDVYHLLDYIADQIFQFQISHTVLEELQ